MKYTVTARCCLYHPSDRHPGNHPFSRETVLETSNKEWAERATRLWGCYDAKLEAVECGESVAGN
jgi:hypothetical protein